ncbi:hypothetical protein [Kineosporia babensis]|uniref:Uncharacterized protein n=1 Tax=Kineosporia babensis TaxID=499548 RepID=A0A9X1NPG3_9ACTN|nr:hypothetical protein [Kineosporia babensis]MCD5316881.1 hypothetical protein [Kineosporia babensis]
MSHPLPPQLPAPQVAPRREIITAVLIPQTFLSPVRIVRLSDGPIAAQQRLLWGTVAAWRLSHPDSILAVREETAGPGIKLNMRASHLAQVHRATAIGDATSMPTPDAPLVFGPALVMGPRTTDGWDTSAPKEFQDVLTHPGPFAIQVSTHSDPDTWNGNDTTFPTFTAAHLWGLDLLQRWRLAKDVRAVAVHPEPSDSPDQS